MRNLATVLCLASIALGASAPASAQNLSASVNSDRGGSGPFDLAGPITYSYANASQRLIAWRTVQPVLCADFGNSQNVLRLQPRDPNGDLPVEGNLLGISAAAYDVTQRRLNLEAGATEPTLKCRVPALVTSAGADLVFSNGFELGGIDLAVSVVAPSVALTPGTLNYTVIVRNLGSAAASSVKVRDFFTKRPTTSTNDPGLTEGTWTCVASGSANCGPSTAGSGRINASGASIPAGAGSFLTFNIARGVLANTTLNSQVSLAAAAFHGPAGNDDDASSGNDSQLRRVVITNNRPPEINFLSSSYVVGVEGQTRPLDVIAFTVTDPDGDPVGVFSTALIGNTAVFASGAVSGSQPNYILALSAAGVNANGSSNVTVRAFDSRGAEAERTITASISAVNNPPTVLISGANCSGPMGIVVTPGTPFVIQLPTSASSRNVTCTGFLTVTPGPGNETGQIVTVSAPALAGDSIFSLKPAPSYLATGGGLYTFEFQLNPAPNAASACVTATAIDSGDNTPPSVNNTTFRVRVNVGAGNGSVGCGVTR